MRRRPKTINDFTHEDRAQVERMLAGDEEAFEAFFEAYYRGLYRFVLARVGHDEELARDVAQSSLCKAIAHLETYRGEASLSVRRTASPPSRPLRQIRGAPSRVETK